MNEYTEWAEQLLKELMLAPVDHRVKILTSHLEKVHQRGYRDAVVNDWWQVQDAEQNKIEEYDAFRKLIEESR